MFQTAIFFILCFIPIWTFSETTPDLENKAQSFVTNYDFMADERENNFSLDLSSLKFQKKSSNLKTPSLVTLLVTGEAELEMSETRKIRHFSVTCDIVFKDSEVLKSDSHCRLKEVPWL